MNSPCTAPPVLLSPVELKEIIAAERASDPFLHWRTQDGNQQLFTLRPDLWRVTIGRDPDADVSLEWDREVSRTHALLERVVHGWTLIDDGFSRNGSFVNGVRVLARHRLADRDQLCLGVTEITYRKPSATEGGETIVPKPNRPVVSLTPMQRKVLIALCRPVHDGTSSAPATNLQIGQEVFLGVDAVKEHLRALFRRYGISDLPQNEKRARLVTLALESGDLNAREF